MLARHLNPFGSQGSPPCIPHHLALSPCGEVIGKGLTDSRGSHPALWTLCGLCPSLALYHYYNRWLGVCQGVSENFFRILALRSFSVCPLRSMVDQTPRTSFGSSSPSEALLPAIPRWRRPDASFTDLPRHRVLRGWSLDPLGNHPLPITRENSEGKVCADHLASPCSATFGVPRRGWGSHPLLTMTFYHIYRSRTITYLGKFLTIFDISGAPAEDHSSENHHPTSTSARLGRHPHKAQFIVRNPTRKHRQNIINPNPITIFSISLTS